MISVESIFAQDGRLDVRVTYSLTDDDELHIDYEALSDRKTLCNLTNHAYFNLSGSYRRKVTEQYLRITSDKFLELDAEQIPTGKLLEGVSIVTVSRVLNHDAGLNVT